MVWGQNLEPRYLFLILFYKKRTREVQGSGLLFLSLLREQRDMEMQHIMYYVYNGLWMVDAAECEQ